MEELVKRYGNPDFDVDRLGGSMHSVLGRYSQIMTSFTRRPVIDKKKCIRCGICVSHCPVPGKAIDFRHERTSRRCMITRNVFGATAAGDVPPERDSLPEAQSGSRERRSEHE